MISPCTAAAAAKGDLLLTGGWFHIAPQSSSKPLHTDIRGNALTRLAGVQDSFDSPGTDATPSDADTLALTAIWFISDHWSLELVGGLPAEFHVRGKGTVLPAGSGINVDLGAPENNPIASVKQWSPTAMVEYHFRSPKASFRPYVGLGASYTWYTDVKLDPDFESDLNQNFGSLLALSNLKAGPTRASGSASASIAPTFVVAFTYELSNRWNLIGSVGGILLETTSTIKIEAEDGTRLSTSKTDMTLNPIVTSLLLAYRF